MSSSEESLQIPSLHGGQKFAFGLCQPYTTLLSFSIDFSLNSLTQSFLFFVFHSSCKISLTTDKMPANDTNNESIRMKYHFLCKFNIHTPILTFQKNICKNLYFEYQISYIHGKNCSVTLANWSNLVLLITKLLFKFHKKLLSYKSLFRTSYNKFIII